MEPDQLDDLIRNLLEHDPAIVTCTEGCTLGIARAGICEHGKSINPMTAEEDLEGLAKITTIAQRTNGFMRALMNGGVNPHFTLYLAAEAMNTLLHIAFDDE